MEEADEPPLPLQDRTRAAARSSVLNHTSYNIPEHPSHSPSHLDITDRHVSDGQSRLSTSKDGASSQSSPNGHFKSHKEYPENASSALPPAAPPPTDTQDASEKHTSVKAKADWPARMKAGSLRFIKHTKDAICHSWINVLLIFVPIGIAMHWLPIPETSKPTVVFALNAIAIIPLAGLLSHATEVVASSMGDTWASLLNVTFGNAVELIIFIALASNEIRITQAAILGSILANLLLILGMAFLLGGLRYREQIYNSTVTQMSACLLSLSVTSLLLPTAFHASFSDNILADRSTLKISRGTSVILLFVYVLYLLFQLKSHAYMYESTPQHIIDEESHPGVLADMMNHSSSSDSSSSSSSDSDSSLGSHATAKKRFTRAVKKRMRRKSSTTNSSHTTSPPVVHSPLHSPTSALSFTQGDRGSITDDQFPHLDGGYFDQSLHQNHGLNGVLSGDEADTDGEHDARDPRPHVRDFETEHTAGESNSSFNRRERKAEKRKKKREKKSKKSSKKSTETSTDDTHKQKSAAGVSDGLTTQAVVEEEKPRVNFSNAEEPSVIPNGVTSSPRRNFARQMSRPNFRAPPPLTSLLSNTVFTTPAPAPARPSDPSQATNLSIAHRTGALRRTSSLPDRLNRPGGAARNASSASRGRQAEPSERAGVLANSDADATLKDAATDGENEHDKPEISRTAAIITLLVTTGFVAFCADLLVDAIPEMVGNTSVSQSFIGLIVLPIVGNAAEHVTAVAVATKNKMDLAIGVAVGSSIQIALFVTPFVVLIGWALGKEMTLYFNLFETVSLFVTAFVINFLILDGRSNYLEGALLIAAYVIIALAAFFYPAEGDQSQVGGGNGA